MAINYFIGWSVRELEAALREAQEDLAAGKSGTLAQAGDARAESQIAKSAEERIRMILKALNQKEPDRYPLDQTTAITQTKAAFS